MLRRFVVLVSVKVNFPQTIWVCCTKTNLGKKNLLHLRLKKNIKLKKLILFYIYFLMTWKYLVAHLKKFGTPVDKHFIMVLNFFFASDGNKKKPARLSQRAEPVGLRNLQVLQRWLQRRLAGWQLPLREGQRRHCKWKLLLICSETRNMQVATCNIFLSGWQH